VLFSSLGEIVEWFDFMIYLSLVPILAQVFCRETHTTAHLAATLGLSALPRVDHDASGSQFCQIAGMKNKWGGLNKGGAWV